MLFRRLQYYKLVIQNTTQIYSSSYLSSLIDVWTTSKIWNVNTANRNKSSHYCFLLLTLLFPLMVAMSHLLLSYTLYVWKTRWHPEKILITCLRLICVCATYTTRIFIMQILYNLTLFANETFVPTGCNVMVISLIHHTNPGLHTPCSSRSK